MATSPDERRGLPLGTDPASVRRRVETMERLLERVVIIPGINKPIGLDVMLDVVPFLGTTAAAAIGSYLAWEARNIGMSKWHIARMAGNIGVDWMLGMIPWVGAIPDLFFRSNTRNLRIIKRHLDRKYPAGAVIDVNNTGPQRP